MNQAPAPTHGTAGAPTRSVTICRVVGIPIRVHWTFAFLVGLVLVADWDTSASVKAEGFLWIAALFVCVIVHEISHCLVARRRGADVVDILLLPIGGMSELTSTPEAPGDEFAIAIVGPLTSLALGALFAAGGLLLGARMWPPRSSPEVGGRASRGSTWFSARSTFSLRCRWTEGGRCVPCSLGRAAASEQPTPPPVSPASSGRSWW
jgi:Zn-dependent protease